MSWIAASRTVLIVFFLAASPAAAELRVAPRGDLRVQPLNPARGPVCLVGNAEAPAWTVADVLSAPQRYEIVFDPLAGCSECARDGYQVSMVHVGIQVSAACQVVLDVAVGEVGAADGAACPVRGGATCTSGLFTVDIPHSGLWDIGIPVECGCSTVEGQSLLSVYFESIVSEDGKMPRLLTEDLPSLCENWLFDGRTWVDLLVEYPAWPGDLSIWADAVCCGSTTARSQTWSTLKGQFD